MRQEKSYALRQGLSNGTRLFNGIARGLLLLFQYTFIYKAIQPMFDLRGGNLKHSSNLGILPWGVQHLLYYLTYRNKQTI